MESNHLESVRDMFDHMFLSSEQASEAILKTLQDTGLESLDKLLFENKQKGVIPGLYATYRPLHDLTQLSFFLYATLDNLPVTKKVELPETNGAYKFIIAGKMSFKGQKPYLILLSTPDAMHAQIAERLDEDKTPLSKLETQVFGGGRLDINHDRKTIRAYNDSGNFGTLSNELVTRFLEEYVQKGYTIEIDMSNQHNFAQE